MQEKTTVLIQRCRGLVQKQNKLYVVKKQVVMASKYLDKTEISLHVVNEKVQK